MSKTPICDRWEYDSYSGGLVVPLNVAKDLETELAEARARITILEGCINDMTEEQAAICAEGQSITELVAAKDKLIEQMRQALEAPGCPAATDHWCSEFCKYIDPMTCQTGCLKSRTLADLHRRFCPRMGVELL